jgi:hypothetical protein
MPDDNANSSTSSTAAVLVGIPTGGPGGLPILLSQGPDMPGPVDALPLPRRGKVAVLKNKRVMRQGMFSGAPEVTRPAEEEDITTTLSSRDSMAARGGSGRWTEGSRGGAQGDARGRSPGALPRGHAEGAAESVREGVAGESWQEARPGVDVKLLPRDGELYVYSQSRDRVAKGSQRQGLALLGAPRMQRAILPSYPRIGLMPKFSPYMG